MDPKIISIHVPKAAGTSLLELWKKSCGVDCVLMDYDEMPGDPKANFIIDPIGWALNRPTVLPDGIKVVHGHFRPYKYDLLKNVFRLTMLRHPVDNLISIYCYWKKIPPQPNAIHEYFLANDLDILGLARLPMIQNLYNDTYFGGWDMGQLDFVGRHENRTEDLTRLAGMLGIKLDTSLHFNATEPKGFNREKEAIVTNTKVVSRLNDLLADDIKFYEKYA